MADLNLYGEIGGFTDESISAARWAEMTSTIDPEDELTVYINSPGGSVFDGLTIYQSLVNRPGENHIVIQGVAASIASVIAMAGDSITMGQASRYMIHNPMGPSAIAFGTADDLRDAAEDTLKTAELLDSVRDTIADVYAARTQQPKKQLLSWMQDETWMTAADAKKSGFADKVLPNKTVQASSFTQPVAVAIEDRDELQRVAELAQSLSLRSGPQVSAQEKRQGRLRLARAKMCLTD
jgi:ATP-dependent Clp endopeptidase proteolytic subunit ClpP